MYFRYHVLLYPGDIHNPPWINEETSASKLETVLTNFINTNIDAMMAISSNKAHDYDVVNEAIDGSEDRQFVEGSWNLVPNYICKAFQIAKSKIGSNPNNSKQLLYTYL